MKSYISRKFPLETRTTDQTFAFRSAEKLIGFVGSLLQPRQRRSIAISIGHLTTLSVTRPVRRASLALVFSLSSHRESAPPSFGTLAQIRDEMKEKTPTR